jgi:predicted methyltransferase
MTRRLYNGDTTSVVYTTPGSLAEELSRSRPMADPKLEQFHMSYVSMLDQMKVLQGRFNQRRVLFLGDDDHMSILLAAFADLSPVVLEIDPRVVDSLQGWANRLHLRDFRVLHHDLRNEMPDIGPPCESFYVNPPYSSKNAGHGIRAWITRAMEVCIPEMEGVLVLPSDEHVSWIDRNWLLTQEFLTANGFRVISCGEIEHYYSFANDQGLKSSNLYVRRVDPTRVLKELPRAGSSLYR